MAEKKLHEHVVMATRASAPVPAVPAPPVAAGSSGPAALLKRYRDRLGIMDG